MDCELGCHVTVHSVLLVFVTESRASARSYVVMS